jgi:hypothetical protein
MFDMDFVNNLRQVHGDNLWPIELINCNYNTRLLCQVKYLLGVKKADQYSLVETSNMKWPTNESDLEDDKYELPI